MTRGARGRKLPSPDEGTVELAKGQEDMSMSSDVVMSGDDADGEDKAAVRLHVVVKEPPKLTKGGSENFEDVMAWKESWTQYFTEVKRVDVARAIAETTVFKTYNLLLTASPGSSALRESDLARMPALEFAELLEAYLRPLSKSTGMEGLETLTKLRGKAVFTIALGKDEVYPGWAKVVEAMKAILVKVGHIPHWETTEDNQELANAFLDIFGDGHLRSKLKNMGKAEGCAGNAFKLWQLANRMLYQAGVAEKELSEGHKVFLNTLVQRGGRAKEPLPKDASKGAGGESSVGKVPAKVAAGACWTCGSANAEHDWKGCRQRTDLTEAEKAAGAAARKARRKHK